MFIYDITIGLKTELKSTTKLKFIFHWGSTPDYTYFNLVLYRLKKHIYLVFMPVFQIRTYDSESRNKNKLNLNQRLTQKYSNLSFLFWVFNPVFAVRPVRVLRWGGSCLENLNKYKSAFRHFVPNCKIIRTRIANYWDNTRDEPCPTSLNLSSHQPFQLHFRHNLATSGFRVSHSG